MNLDRANLFHLLCHAQANLEGDLSLSALARVTSLSPAYLSREFRRLTGENLKAYTSRIRLERAALRLALLDESILRIALDHGYQSHEAFSRAFRQHFGISPREYKAQRKSILVASQQHKDCTQSNLDHRLSRTDVRTLAPMWLAFIRQVGPYQQVSPKLFTPLIRWAKSRGHAEPHVVFGIAHDAPGITPESHLRFDACLRVPSEFCPTRLIGCQYLPARTFAFTTWVGDADSIPKAYEEIISRLRADQSLVIEGVPALEFYRMNQISPELTITHTEIGIPVHYRRAQKNFRK